MKSLFQRLLRKGRKSKSESVSKELLLDAKELLQDRYGSRRHYKPRQVRRILRNKVFENTLELYIAYAVFCSQNDYERFCAFQRMECDYETHTDLRHSIVAVASLSGANIGADFNEQYDTPVDGGFVDSGSDFDCGGGD